MSDPWGRAAMGVIILIAGVGLWAYGVDQHVTVSCPEQTNKHCTNPLYQTCDEPVCQIEFILPGEMIGEPKPPYYEVATFFMILVAGAAVIHKHRHKIMKDWKELRK